MARKKKTDAVDDLAKTVNAVRSEASSTMLRMAAQAAVRPGKVERAGRVMQFASICDEAADHVARAHTMLFDEPDKAEVAMTHLDAALVCLKQLSVEAPAEQDDPDREQAQTA
ncbi:MAG: hypothetical protein ACR2PO_02810 [Methyloligellaceae bacterium]